LRRDEKGKVMKRERREGKCIEKRREEKGKVMRRERREGKCIEKRSDEKVLRREER